MRLTNADLARLGADSEGRRTFARDPDRHPFASRPGATAGQHAQAAAPAVNAGTGPGALSDGDVCAPRNKYGAVRTVAPASWGGTRLADSKAGARLARTLDTRKQVGSILDWAEEVSIPVGVDEDGKVIRYRADALVLLGYVDAPDGGEPALVVRLIDAKKRGMDTPTSKAKRAALRARGWNVEIHET